MLKLIIKVAVGIQKHLASFIQLLLHSMKMTSVLRETALGNKVCQKVCGMTVPAELDSALSSVCNVESVDLQNARQKIEWHPQCTSQGFC